jgi:hypothetical protein
LGGGGGGEGDKFRGLLPLTPYPLTGVE